jgi:hypothetical protein
MFLHLVHVCVCLEHNVEQKETVFKVAWRETTLVVRFLESLRAVLGIAPSADPSGADSSAGCDTTVQPSMKSETWEKDMVGQMFEGL